MVGRVQIAVVNFAPWHLVAPLLLFERSLEAAFSLVEGKL